MRRLAGTAASVLLLAASCSLARTDTLRVGAVYPLSGSQGPGGVDEYHGVLTARQLVNDDGGVNGRPIDIRAIDVDGPDAAPGAVDQLHDDGIGLVLGSYGSTISASAAARAAGRGMVFWETGAVGMLPPAADPGTTTFRVSPNGGALGRAAISFVAKELAPKLGRDASGLRFAVSFVDDIYGRTVAEGADDELDELGLHNVGDFGYQAATVDMHGFVRRIAAAKPDVLFVSAYLQDGIELRRTLVDEHVPLLVNIGTSSSYCLPAFAAALGQDAVGVFASDKPAAGVLNPSGLRPDAAALLTRANDAYRERFGADMSAAALAGFSGAWALFHDVLPAAQGSTPEAVARAARAADIPSGGLPNGSGLLFGAPGGPGAGDNERAASVIWEWVAPNQHVVVWPPPYATTAPDLLSISPW